jgi:hypothetical protein
MVNITYITLAPLSPILQPSVHTPVSVSHLSQYSPASPILQPSVHTLVSESHLSQSSDGCKIGLKGANVIYVILTPVYIQTVVG